jgi:hypothetical protein
MVAVIGSFLPVIAAGKALRSGQQNNEILPGLFASGRAALQSSAADH